MKKRLSYFFKGVIIGAAMLIPGVSGGTTAIILGIYDKMISAFCSLSKSFMKNATLLLTIGVGTALGIVVFSNAVLYVVESYELPMTYLFMGAVLGSIPLLYRKSGITRIGLLDLRGIIYQLIGLGIIIAIGFLPKNMFGEISGIGSIVVILLAGITVAAALILPGISVSFMLLVLGLYEKTLSAVKTFDIGFLLPLLIAVVVGSVLTAKLLERAMNSHPKPTYMIIAGFVIGSLGELFIGLPRGLDIIICFITFFLGLSSVYLLSRRSE